MKVPGYPSNREADESTFGSHCAAVWRGQFVDYPASILEVPVVQSGAETNVEEILPLEPQVVLEQHEPERRAGQTAGGERCEGRCQQHDGYRQRVYGHYPDRKADGPGPLPLRFIRVLPGQSCSSFRLDCRVRRAGTALRV